MLEIFVISMRAS